MTDKCLTLVTAGTMREAKGIARRLVESRLAACVSIGGRLLSIYRWKGKLVAGEEVLLLIKSKRSAFAGIAKMVRANHSYTTPEIISLPISKGSQDYLAWIDASTKAAPQRGANPQRRLPRARIKPLRPAAGTKG